MSTNQSTAKTVAGVQTPSGPKNAPVPIPRMTRAASARPSRRSQMPNRYSGDFVVDHFLSIKDRPLPPKRSRSMKKLDDGRPVATKRARTNAVAVSSKPGSTTSSAQFTSTRPVQKNPATDWLPKIDPKRPSSSRLSLPPSASASGIGFKQPLPKTTNQVARRIVRPAASIASFRLPQQQHVKVLQISADCRVGPLFKEDEIRALQPYRNLSYPDQFTRLVQDLIGCAHRPEAVFEAIRVAAEGEPSTVVTCFDPLTGHYDLKRIPVVEDFESAMTWLGDLLQSLQCCRSLIVSGSCAEMYICRPCFEWNHGQQRTVDVNAAPPTASIFQTLASHSSYQDFLAFLQKKMKDDYEEEKRKREAEKKRMDEVEVKTEDVVAEDGEILFYTRPTGEAERLRIEEEKRRAEEEEKEAEMRRVEEWLDKERKRIEDATQKAVNDAKKAGGAKMARVLEAGVMKSERSEVHMLRRVEGDKNSNRQQGMRRAVAPKSLPILKKPKVVKIDPSDSAAHYQTPHLSDVRVNEGSPASSRVQQRKKRSNEEVKRELEEMKELNKVRREECANARRLRMEKREMKNEMAD